MWHCVISNCQILLKILCKIGFEQKKIYKELIRRVRSDQDRMVTNHDLKKKNFQLQYIQLINFLRADITIAFRSNRLSTRKGWSAENHPSPVLDTAVPSREKQLGNKSTGEPQRRCSSSHIYCVPARCTRPQHTRTHTLPRDWEFNNTKIRIAQGGRTRLRV
jgi:hypothetical protein